MPITKLFKDSSFDPETITLLASAFDTAWSVVEKSGSPLGAPDQAAATREALAKRIIKLGESGERNKQRLVDEALSGLTLPR
jgi:hypothetical protein